MPFSVQACHIFEQLGFKEIPRNVRAETLNAFLNTETVSKPFHSETTSNQYVSAETFFENKHGKYFCIHFAITTIYLILEMIVQ